MSPVALIIVLAGLAGAGFLLLRKPPAQQAPPTTGSALDPVALIGSFVTEWERLTTMAGPDLANQWADSIVGAWGELPDSWILARDMKTAGLEIGEYLPAPGGHEGRSPTPDVRWTALSDQGSGPSPTPRWVRIIRGGWNARVLLARQRTITPEQVAALETARATVLERLGFQGT